MTSIRRAGAASGATLSALALALGIAHAAAPRWSERVGLDVWNYSAAHDRMRAVGEREAEIDRVRARLLREIEISDHIVVRLGAGKLTLREAVERLEPILRSRPGFDTVWEDSYRVPTFRHGVARYAITHVGLKFQDDPSHWAAVGPRLEAEYAALN